MSACTSHMASYSTIQGEGNRRYKPHKSAVDIEVSAQKSSPKARVINTLNSQTSIMCEQYYTSFLCRTDYDTSTLQISAYTDAINTYAAQHRLTLEWEYNQQSGTGKITDWWTST